MWIIKTLALTIKKVLTEFSKSTSNSEVNVKAKKYCHPKVLVTRYTHVKIKALALTDKKYIQLQEIFKL